MTVPDLTGRIARLTPERRARLAQSLRGASPDAPAPEPAPHPSRWPNACLRLGPPGHLDRLRFEAMETDPPAPGQIRIRAHAVSLNFRDLMIAMGLYPPTPEVPSVMGSDYAGEVIACGAGVDSFAPGDRVMALSVGHAERDGGIRADSHFCAAPNVWAFQAVRLPDTLGYIEGASLPTAFLTAYYGLHHVARLSAGERVLIHSATGGVGLAAIAVARWLGAEIVATAGSEAKRDDLRRLGVTAAHDSRSLAFAEAIPGGVDVILNTLSGAAVERGLALLRPFGRFLQIDKHDIASDAALPLAAFRNGLSFAAIDLSLFLRRPETMTRLFGELAGHFAAGRLRPTPIRTFPVQQIPAALNWMSSFRHRGKIVIDYEAAL